MIRYHRALALVAVAGCGYSDGPVANDPGVVGASYVEQALAPGAHKVSVFQPWRGTSTGDGFVDRAAVRVARGADGSRIVSVIFASSTSPTVGNTPFEAMFALSADGTARKLSRPADAPAFADDPRVAERSVSVAVVDGVDTPTVLQCLPNDSTALAFRLDAEGALRASRLPADICPAHRLVGPSSLPGHVVTAVVANGKLVLQSRRVDDGSGQADATGELELPAGFEPSRASVRETAPGVFVAIGAIDGAVAFVQTGAPAVRADVVGLGAGERPDRVTRDETTGQIHMFASTGVVVWTPGDAPSWVASPAVPSSLGDAAWVARGSPGGAVALTTRPNDESSTVRVPVAAAARVFVAGAFASAVAPTTPCVSTAACREIGESYLVAVFDAAPRSLGLYAFWSWTGELALFTAPVGEALP